MKHLVLPVLLLLASNLWADDHSLLEDLDRDRTQCGTSLTMITTDNDLDWGHTVDCFRRASEKHQLALEALQKQVRKDFSKGGKNRKPHRAWKRATEKACAMEKVTYRATADHHACWLDATRDRIAEVEATWCYGENCPPLKKRKIKKMQKEAGESNE